MGRKQALLIATYDYADAALSRLTAPAHDADDLAEVLGDPAIGGFEVTMLVNEPHHRVGEAIGDLYRDQRRDDLTLLYFTGHGLKDDSGRLYMAMANTRRDNLLFTAVTAEQVDQAMSASMARQNVLVLDCCYSGAFPAGRFAKADSSVHALDRFRGQGRSVLTASDATQYAFEGDQLHGETAARSVFTRHLVAGLRDGSADLDRDGNITLDELYGYVYDRVVAEVPQQRPKKQDNVEGRIVIARNVNWTLPEHVRDALRSPLVETRLSVFTALGHLGRVGNATVRAKVVSVLEELTDDDSRRVCAAAADVLRELGEAPPETPAVPDADADADAAEARIAALTSQLAAAKEEFEDWKLELAQQLWAEGPHGDTVLVWPWLEEFTTMAKALRESPSHLLRDRRRAGLPEIGIEEAMRAARRLSPWEDIMLGSGPPPGPPPLPVFRPFWFSVPEPRRMVSPPGPPAAELIAVPGIWYLAVGELDDGWIVEVESERWVLKDVSRVQRGD
ncbi:caspase family protein [Yinghuangia seranimata]|uniref:caspase family protein n=1 Tax=Yinghuangia seranimata TaxID=408067 RepID=UPI00248C20F6|nr:caspase family protein [Yinghuangia seranimata]MDI2130749.1 caspase family protein [Yinghuangia seranimata]